MPFTIITIPFSYSTQNFYTDILNDFCLNKRILQNKVKFFSNEDKHFWTVFLEYEILVNPEGKDETFGLPETGFLCFQKLKEWRKETAEKEGIPHFVIAKNQTLVEIIQKEVTTIESLKQIRGFGEKKIEKYGKEIIGIVSKFYGEKT